MSVFSHSPGPWRVCAHHTKQEKWAFSGPETGNGWHSCAFSAQVNQNVRRIHEWSEMRLCSVLIIQIFKAGEIVLGIVCCSQMRPESQVLWPILRILWRLTALWILLCIGIFQRKIRLPLPGGSDLDMGRAFNKMMSQMIFQINKDISVSKFESNIWIEICLKRRVPINYSRR